MSKEIKVFIISPDDVSLERMIVKKICEELNTSIDESIRIVPIVWEDYPLTYTNNPQESINRLLESSDIYIVILWHRLGTVVEGMTGAISGSKEVTGTQYEIEKIISLGKERIFFYFKRVEPTFNSSELEDALVQKTLLQQFLSDMNLEKGSTKHGYQEFDAVDDFRKKVQQHLGVEIEKISGKIVHLSPYNRVKPRVYIVSFILLILMGMWWLYPINNSLLSGLDIQKNIPIHQKKKGIFVIFQSPHTKSNFLTLFSKQFHSNNIQMMNNQKEAKFILTATVNFKKKKYFIAEDEMVRGFCTLSYRLEDSINKTMIDTYSIQKEALDFNVLLSKQKCYDSISRELILHLDSALRKLK